MTRDTLPKPNEAPKGASKAVALLTTLIVILVAALLALGWLYRAERREALQVQAELRVEKDSIASNLRQIVLEYQEMQTDNEALQAKLQEEQERAEQLYAELRQVRSVSFAKIREYQRELGTLRAILKDMVHELDSLNTLNQQLMAENIQVRQEYTIAQRAVETLERRTEELSTTVAKGSVVRARDIAPLPINRRGNEVTRARRAEKIRTCFVLTANSIARPGSRTVFKRITTPDGVLLAQSATDLFEFEGDKIVFSASREVDYQNEDVEMCIFYSNSGELAPGAYQVSLYMDGHLIGQRELLLK